MIFTIGIELGNKFTFKVKHVDMLIETVNLLKSAHMQATFAV